MKNSRQNSFRFFYCVLLSAFMWLFIAMNKEYAYTITANMLYEFPKGKVNKEQLPKTVQLNVSAGGWKLLKASYFEQDITIGAKTISGNSVFSNNANRDIFSKQLSQDLIIRSISPDTLIFQPDNFLRKKIPVKLQSAVVYAERNDTLNWVQISPDSILISGPSSYVSNITYWKTEYLDIKEINKDASGILPLALNGPPTVELSAIAVQYQIKVYEMEDTVLNYQLEDSTFISISFMYPTTMKDSIHNKIFSFSRKNIEENNYEVELISSPNWASNIKISETEK